MTQPQPAFRPHQCGGREETARRRRHAAAWLALPLAVALAGAASGCGDRDDSHGGGVGSPGLPTQTPTPTPTQTPLPLGVEFTLAPGQAAAVDGGRMRVEFVSVTSDSRCPVAPGVVCAWEGDAVVAVTVEVAAGSAGGTQASATSGEATSGEVTSGEATTGEATTAELHTNSQFDTAATAGRYEVALVGLVPNPPVDQPGAYRATFRTSAR